MRLLLLCKRELAEKRKQIVILTLILFLILLLSELSSVVIAQLQGLHHIEVYDRYLVTFLFLGGFIATSLAFSTDLFSKRGQHHYLMLPAQNWEKFTSKAFIYVIGYPLFVIILFTLTSLIGETLFLLIFNDSFAPFIPWRKSVLALLLHYVVLNSLFFLGATYFKSAHFIKTVLALLTVIFGFSLLSTLLIRVIFNPYFDSFIMINLDQLRTLSASFEQLGRALKLLYWILLAPFCYLVAYFRLQEVEATDAIQ